MRSFCSVIFKAKTLRRLIIATVLIAAIIATIFLFLPKTNVPKTDSRAVYTAYSAHVLLKLDSLEKVRINCDLSKAKPEIAYVLPLIVNAYNSVVARATTPIIMRLDDTLMFKMSGYKQFKNRRAKLNKLLQKKLGNRYSISITSNGANHILQVSYIENLWDNEQLAALPVIEAAQINNIDPALLMSLIRHVSDFNFDFRGLKDSHGLLALESGKDLEQIFLGAKRLSSMLQIGISTKNAIASFYPTIDIYASKNNWSKSPLIKSWVNQVLNDIEFYHSNGM